MLALRKDLRASARPGKDKILAGFFKTGKGEYGEGDVFLGVMVPDIRRITRKYSDIGLSDIKELLKSKIHEERLVALLILVGKFKKSPKEVYDFYMDNLDRINNWDLVDSSAPNIVGNYLLDRDRSILYKLAEGGLWERRIAIVSTLAFIRKNDFDDTFRLAGVLMKDEHDLIHKAAGWMLREAGKRDQKALESFLKKYYKIMPRTMLRYSIEKFDKKKKTFYMKK